METLAISSSIINSNGLNVFLRKKFGLSESSKCKLLKTGINHTYKIEDGEDSFIYRIYSYNWRSKTEILEEIKFIDLLKDNKISVSYAIADVSNQKIQEIKAPEGVRYGVLFSYAQGQKNENLPTEKHKEIGKIIGQIHKLSNGLELQRPNYSLKKLLESSLLKISTILTDNCEEMNYLKSVVLEVLDKMDATDSLLLREGIVHLDIWNDNFHLDNKGKVTIFDFDFCGNGFLALDISYYILQLINLEKDETICIEKIKEFLNGYESIVQISKEERIMLHHLGMSLYIFYLGVQCERFENWSNVFLNESYLKKYINLVIKRYQKFKYWT